MKHVMIGLCVAGLLGLATGVHAGNEILTWEAVPHAEQYQVEKQLAGGDWGEIYAGTDLTTTDLNAELGVQRCYRVRATNAVADGPWGPEACVMREAPAAAGSIQLQWER